MMIQCQQVQKGYGAESVLLEVTCDIGENERVGLIGRNGTGKTTLLQLLNGSEKPDGGQISIRKGTQIGYLDQVPRSGDDETVRDVLERAFCEPRQWLAEMRELERIMADPEQAGGADGFERLLYRYGDLQEKFERAGGYDIDAHVGRVAGGLGIPDTQYGRLFASLSGGEKTKVGLAAMLIEEPDVLLLDEPTNHLDMQAIDWLERFLQAYAGTVVVISHDRYFLDRVVTKIIELEDGEAVTYHTNYTGFQQEKEARLLQQFANFQEQQKKIKKMQETIKQLIEWGNRANPPNPGFHRRAASMQKALDRMVKLKRPMMERRAMELELQQGDRSGNQVLTLEDVGKAFGERVLFSGVRELLRYGERVALIGENGSGKSTLLKCILGVEALDEGEIRLGSRVDVGYLAQEAAPEDENATVLQHFREAVGMEEGEARGRLARFLFCGADVFKSIRSLSGGEWSRLRFALLMHRQPNLLVLDEPTNHLDIDSREALEEALEEFPGTVLAVSHDRYFINRLAVRIWSLEAGQLVTVHGNFDNYKAKADSAREGGASPKGREREDAARSTRTARKVPASQVDAARTHANPSGCTARQKSLDQAGAGKTMAARGQSDESARSGGRSHDRAADPLRLERDIAELEQELRSLDAAMMAPALAADAEKLAVLHAEREALQAKLEMMYEAWMDAAAQ
ncbi:ABC-F family ATP-binding cassette domain-containing protein [Paenibacillus sp. MER TA 81-3]|uniref:ribosomal protection-like ABC-F family protein n=1 Tax=Paenibacillus sp. MER TA 81-3 TaxID=2939573 RepID=UPI00203BCDF2|nr:ABC-F family ATP-binding cassette domain-containing protein [Paenibacillus sp. MER TA 81-3]MCM3340015.1 ABC-F family ATP-binding cassette domain-containing protein [Paenibacillus sp. MER TA 81-3]